MFPASQMYNKFDFIPLVEQHVSPYGSSATGCWNVGKKSQLKLKTPYYYYLLCYCRPATAHTGWTLPHDGRGAALVHIFPWHSTPHTARRPHTRWPVQTDPGSGMVPHCLAGVSPGEGGCSHWKLCIIARSGHHSVTLE